MMQDEHGVTVGSEGAQLILPGIGDNYQVKLDIFEGPLDLLLHLIRASELDITDVSIAAVSEQYLQYLDFMRELNIDIAGDYLVMAATLALIKSRMLLPPTAGDAEDEEPDPAAQLIERLLEYRRYKEVAGKLAELNLLGREVFAIRTPPQAEVGENEREIEVGLFELIKVYKELLERVVREPAHHTMEREPVSVHECMALIMNVLENRESIAFREFFEVANVEITRPMLVGTFIGILELTRIAAIRIFQAFDELGAPDGPIRICSRENGREQWTKRVAEVT